MKNEGVLKGSLTIEITLLMPFILGVFMFILFSGFVLHDKCVVNKACMSAALRGSQESDDNIAVDKAALALSEVLPGKLIGKWSYNTSIDVGKDVIRITFDGDTDIGSGLVKRVLSTGNTSHSYECESFRLKEAEYIRTSRKSGVGYCL